MKLKLSFDPEHHDYGPASAAVRRTLQAWAEIDWFVPSGLSDDEGARLFGEHNSLAHAYAPELFAPSVDIRFMRGGWSELQALCKRVQGKPWDWKFDILKKLTKKHSAAHNWTLEAEAQRLPVGMTPAGNLLLRWGDGSGKEFVLWSGLSCKVDPLEVPTRYIEAAMFYVSFAQGDALACIEWLFAEKRDDLATNPFWPLLGCYLAGFLPFSIDRQTVMMFRFEADERVLPRATVVRLCNQRHP